MMPRLLPIETESEPEARLAPGRALTLAAALLGAACLPGPALGQNVFPLPSGNVGIGTAQPATTLHMFTTGITQATSETTAGFAQYRVVSGSRAYQLSTAGSSIGAPYTGAFYIHDETAGATRLLISSTGNVGIGTTNPQHPLQVAGTIGAEEVLVTPNGADYVFDPAYRLAPLSEVATYIQANHHLPDIPSAEESKQNGVGVGEMQSKLLAKIEELTLHMIQADERNRRLERQNQELRDRVARLETQSVR